MDVNEVQSENAELPIEVIESGMETDVSEEHEAKAWSPMEALVSGVKSVELSAVRSSGVIETEVKAKQCENALLPIEVMKLGRETEVSEKQQVKAESPIKTTELQPMLEKNKKKMRGYQ